MAKLILGLIAKQGGGKGTVAELIKKRFGAASHRFSDPVRELLDSVGVPHERSKMQDFAQEMRRIHGTDILERIVIKRCVGSDTDIAIADGIREPDDIRNLLRRDDFRVIYLKVPQWTRWDRLRNRGENAGEEDLSWSDFLKAEEHPNELAIDETIRLAKSAGNRRDPKLETIPNDGTPEDLEKHLQRTLRRLAAQYGFSLAA